MFNKEVIIICLIFYILINIYIFIRVSKLNRSYFNSYSISTASLIFIQISPFIIYIFNYSELLIYSDRVLLIFILSLYLSTIIGFLGYKLGFRKRIKIPALLVKPSKLSINILIFLSLIFAILAFVLMGYKSVGVTNWIFNNREAYLQGRKGVGLYYILYELMIIIFFVSVLVKRSSNFSKFILLFIALTLAYFTGSKQFVLGLVVASLLFYDLYIKKISFKKILMVLLCMILLLSVLLKVQSNSNILEYGGNDYYNNYLMLLDAYEDNQLDFYYGKLNFENSFWFLIPRSIYPEKPFVYGQSTLVAHFYGSQSVINGNTPSFSSLGVPYAEFGLLGISLIFFVKGLFIGLIEKTLRYHLKEEPYLLIFFLYIILFFAWPINFSNFYLLIFSFILLLYLFFFNQKKKVNI